MNIHAPTNDPKEMATSQWHPKKQNTSSLEPDVDSTLKDQKKDIPYLVMALDEDGKPLFHWRVKEDRKLAALHSNTIKMHVAPFLDSSSEVIIHPQSFKEYSIIVLKDEDLSFCYVFRGSSKSAKNRIIKLLEAVKQNKALWKDLTTNTHHHIMGRWEIALLRKVTNRILAIE